MHGPPTITPDGRRVLGQQRYDREVREVWAVRMTEHDGKVHTVAQFEDEAAARAFARDYDYDPEHPVTVERVRVHGQWG